MILPDVPKPYHFFSGVCRAVNLMMGGNELFKSNECEIERGWVWLPGIDDLPQPWRLQRLAEGVIRAAGGKLSATRGRYYHVGTSWAPCERLLNNCGVSRERGGMWSDPRHYDGVFASMLTYIDELAKEEGITPHPFLTARAIRNMTTTGWLINDTPRKKREYKVDPTIAILRAGGLL